MKFLQIFRFELRCQLRRLHTWLFAFFLVAVAVIFVRSAFVSDATYSDTIINSPFSIAMLSVLISMFWLIIAGAVAGEIAARDTETGVYPMLYTSPVNKMEYLGGKFVAALTVNAGMMLLVLFTVISTVHFTGIDPAVVGPFRWEAYFGAFFFIMLPNVFLGTAVQFFGAVAGRRTFAAYLSSLVLFGVIYASIFILLFFIKNEKLAVFFDGFAHLTVFEMIRGWTPIEKETRLMQLTGPLLHSRAIWFAVSVVVLVVTYINFRFAHHTAAPWWKIFKRRTKKASVVEDLQPAAAITVPVAERSFTGFTQIRQLLSLARWSFAALMIRRGGLIFCLLIGLITVRAVPENMEMLGTPLIPTTDQVLGLMTHPLTDFFSPWVILPFVIILFAGELVWRQREAGLGEIFDASPVPSWVMWAGRFAALTLFLISMLAMLMVSGIAAQLIMGYRDFDIGMYCTVLFGLQLPEYLLFASLALAVHGVMTNKYIAHLLLFFLYGFIIFASALGIQDHLLIFSSSPAWRYTPMRGFGGTIGAWVWLKLYWVLWTIILTVAAILCWHRGNDRAFTAAAKYWQLRFTRPLKIVVICSLVLLTVLGGTIFYQTHIVGGYLSSKTQKRLQAEYELRYARYRNVPQPEIKATSLHIELYPDAGKIEIMGACRLYNHHQTPIDTLHLSIAARVDTGSISLSRRLRKIVADDDHGYRMYVLDEPMLPGGNVTLNFRIRLVRSCFSNSGASMAIAENGTYFLADELLPVPGYKAERELIKPHDRREHGLPARPLIPTLDQAGDVMEEAAAHNLFQQDLNIVIGTAAGQTAIAPGKLVKTWRHEQRNYFYYAASEAAEMPVFSARYALHEESRDGVTIQLYHHPGHTANNERLLNSVRASLDYHAKHIHPYNRGYIKIVENPVRKNGAHATMAIIDYGSLFSVFDGSKIGEGPDMPFAVMAHEMGHQWWPGQLRVARVEGIGVMGEGLAWFSGMGVVEETYGLRHLRRLRRFFRQPYPIMPLRLGVPLIRSLDPYSAYRKAPFVLYAMGEYMGRERVNLALKRLVQKNKDGTLKEATTRDLYNELKEVTPDTLQPMLREFFALNTIWELEMKNAIARKQSGGKWQVSLRLQVRKVVVDSAGVENELPMNDWLEVGVFAPRKEEEDAPGRPLHLQKHRIRSGEQEIHVIVDEKPARAAIDPYHLMIDHDTDDNYRRVTVDP